MLYLLFKRKSMAELDANSDLIARQYAQADRDIDRVETETGRVVYRRVKEGVDKWADAKKPLPDVDLSSFEIDPEAVERFDRATRRKTT